VCYNCSSKAVTTSADWPYANEYTFRSVVSLYLSIDMPCCLLGAVFVYEQHLHTECGAVQDMHSLSACDQCLLTNTSNSV
jgi:hypothetical protein